LNTAHTRRSLLSLLLILATLLTLASPALAFENASSWALGDLQEAEILGLLPESMQSADMKAEITRMEMCYIATSAYEKLTGNSPTPNNTDYFLDTADPLICAAYEIGIVSGYDDGTFKPEQLLTRQEFFVILSNLNRCIGMPIHLTTDYLKDFSDRDMVSYWAENAAQEMVGLGIVHGNVDAQGNTVLLPKDNTSRQEAIVMFLRCYKNADQFLLTDWITEEELQQLQQAAEEEAASSEAAALVEYALSFVGCSYVFGATGPNSFDCSGFTQYVYAHFGYTINRVADDQVNNGVAVDFANLQPGDLVCFSNTYSSSDWITHVGIYIGDGKMVHAANSRRGVTVDTITSGYYYSHYAAARRILN
jgi:cell wall-associated NlpC family hydrolase